MVEKLILIFSQGLATVFALINDSTFSCSAMNIGDIMIFRVHQWEVIEIVVKSLFFVARYYFRSAFFDVSTCTKNK